jgi:hypothetical protein
MVGMLTQVSLTPIPRGVVWKRKRKTGEAEIVTPVPKPKTLVATTKTKALRNGSVSRLTNGHGPQGSPFVNASRKIALLRNTREEIARGPRQAELI